MRSSRQLSVVSRQLFVLAMLSSVVCGLLSSCKVYSFTGASISPDIKSVTIQNFTNQSENGNTAVNQNLTDLLKNKFLSETNLSLANSGGDLEFSGAVTGYAIRGQAPTANETTALNRLTIIVKADYLNNVNEKENWSQAFTRYADYESTQNLADVERQLVNEINTQIAEDIFNKAFVNW
ncbi:MAG: LPS assembly lipoprotein LptE [Chitinophagales bacterium]|nr:LPS assembly lipoprotein LptE [Chitinophagales bacterium]